MGKVTRVFTALRNALIKSTKPLQRRLRSLFNKHETNNTPKTSVRESLRVIFFSKKTIIFLLSYVSIGILLGILYFNQIYNAAKTEKVFEVTLDLTNSPTDILSDKLIFGNGYSSIFGMEAILILILPLFVELVCIFFILYFRKRVRKRVLVLFFIAFQAAIVIMFFYHLYIPNSVVSKLKSEAYSSVEESIAILGNKDKLSEKAKNPDCISCIASEIKSETKPPILIENYPVETAVMELKGIALAGNDTFYNAVVIPYVITTKGENDKIDSNLAKIHFNALLFPNSVLIIGNVNKQMVQELSPVIAEKLLSENYPEYMESYKTIDYNVLNQGEYIAYQVREDEKKKNEIKNAIAGVNSEISSIDDIISDNQRIIDSYENDKKENKASYKEYVTELQNKYDTLCTDFEDLTACQGLKQTIGENKTAIEDESKALDENMNNAIKYNKEAEASKNYYVGIVYSLQKTLDAIEKDPITPEYQNAISYLSENEVFINFYDSGTRLFSDYLYTTLHEFLHVYSYKPGIQLPIFLEEGLTEYQTAKLLQNYTGNGDEKITYIPETDIISLLLTKVPQEELLEIYFDKSDNNLKRIFTKYYDTATYGDFISKGNFLYYTDVNDIEAKVDKYLEIENILTKE